MKKLLLPILLIFSTTAFAQEIKKTEFKSFYELSKGKPITGKIEFRFPLEYNNSAERMQIMDGKMIVLPLDNMPCLVPDTKGFNMPLSSRNASSNMPIMVPVPVK